MALTQSQIFQAATEFRNAAAAWVSTPGAPIYISLQHFPDGACQDTSIMLANYLISLGAGEVEMVRARQRRHGDMHWHAWLVVDGFIVDVTGDQDDFGQQPLVVTAMSAWHDGWELEVREDPSDPDVVGMAMTDYGKIVALIPARRMAGLIRR